MPEPDVRPPPVLYRPERHDANDPLPEGAELVSIVIRTKDRQILLPRAFDSVLAQRFTDWRIYLVNDGGDPAPVERLLRAYANRLDGRLTLLDGAETRGMEAASNTALAVARGEFFVIHDDDDTWHEAFLERTVRFLTDPANAGYIGVVTNGNLVTERMVGDAVTVLNREPWPFHRPHVDFRRVMARNHLPPIAVLYRRSIVSRIGAFNVALPVLGDWEFALRALTLGDIGTIDDLLANYHIRQDGADTAYGNTTVEAAASHERYNVLLRNSAIREALRHEPALIGAIQPILHALEEQAAAVTLLGEQFGQRFERLTDVIERRLTGFDREILDIRAVVASQQSVRRGFRLTSPLVRPVRRLLSWLATLAS